MRLMPIAAFASLLTSTAFAQSTQPGVAAPEAARAAQAASAQGAVTSEEDVRVNQLIVYGTDPCPQSTNNDEIVVCARLPENDRFRIPPNLRGDPNDPANQSWANRAIELSYVGRTGTDSCSTVGPGGFTGCQQQLINQARAERRGGDRINWERLIDEARQERLSRIDAAAREEEGEVREREAQPPR